MGTGEAGRTRDDHCGYTSAAVWRSAERPIADQDGAINYYWRKPPADTTRTQRAAYVRARWPIEPFDADAKQACGVGDDQGRRWDGLHRHVARVMLADSFLVQQRMTEPERTAGACSPCGTTTITAIRPSWHPAVVTSGSRAVVDCD
jgi:SRSO17 transposase